MRIPRVFETFTVVISAAFVDLLRFSWVFLLFGGCWWVLVRVLGFSWGFCGLARAFREFSNVYVRFRFFVFFVDFRSVS